jgi:hypothetical protein
VTIANSENQIITTDVEMTSRCIKARIVASNIPVINAILLAENKCLTLANSMADFLSKFFKIYV